MSRDARVVVAGAEDDGTDVERLDDDDDDNRSQSSSSSSLVSKRARRSSSSIIVVAFWVFRRQRERYYCFFLLGLFETRAARSRKLRSFEGTRARVCDDASGVPRHKRAGVFFSFFYV